MCCRDYILNLALHAQRRWGPHLVKVQELVHYRPTFERRFLRGIEISMPNERSQVVTRETLLRDLSTGIWKKRR